MEEGRGEAWRGCRGVVRRLVTSNTSRLALARINILYDAVSDLVVIPFPRRSEIQDP